MSKAYNISGFFRCTHVAESEWSVEILRRAALTCPYLFVVHAQGVPWVLSNPSNNSPRQRAVSAFCLRYVSAFHVAFGPTPARGLRDR